MNSPTPVIGDVLALRLSAIDTIRLVVIRIERAKFLVLFDDAFGHLVEGDLRVIVHPRVEHTRTIPLHALVIESVRQFVATDDTESAKIG
jgi:hypothetical protein